MEITKILVYLFLLSYTNLILANDVEIKDKKNPTIFPCDGYITVKATGSAGPYDIVLTAKSTGNTWTANNITTEYQFTGLCGDYYTIAVYTNSGCILPLTAELQACNDLEIHSKQTNACGTNKGSLQVWLDGNSGYFSYTWLDKNNKVLSNNSYIDNLGPGDYRVIIKDSRKPECMFTKAFNIEAINILVKSEKLDAICYNQYMYEIFLEPGNRTFKFNWSDGFSEESKRTVSRHMRNPISSTNSSLLNLDIIDKKSNCSISRKVKMNSAKGNLELKEIIHASTSQSYDGIVTLYFRQIISGEFGYDKARAQVWVYRNGAKIRTETWTRNSTLTLLIKNLQAGFYNFELYDINGCFVSNLELEIYACDQTSLKPSIKIKDYSLPPDKPDAYAKAEAKYEGGDISKCNYRWYTNDFNSYYTNYPELNNVEIQKLYSQEGGTNICVKMRCPCGIAEDCVPFNPCHPDARLIYSKRDIEKLCFGFLPTGDWFNHKSSALIDFTIDLTRYFAPGVQGLPSYDFLIKSIKWSDGANVNVISYTRNRSIRIQRTVNLAQDYELVVVSGAGCILLDKFKVENEFNYLSAEGAMEDNCYYLDGCGKIDRHTPGKNFMRIMKIVGSNDPCDFGLYCGEKLIEKLPVYISEPGEIIEKNGQCYYSSVCFFNYSFERIDPSIQNPDLHVSSYTNVLGNQDLKVTTYFLGECCYPSQNSSEEDIKRNLLHVNLDRFMDNNIDINVQAASNGSFNPCIASYRCPTTGYYYKIVGSKIAESKCYTLDGEGQKKCKYCFKCQYQINGKTISDNFRNYDNCLDYDGNDCPNRCEIVEPNPIAPQNNSKVQKEEIHILPNLVDTYVDIDYSSLVLHEGMGLVINIFDPSGKPWYAIHVNYDKNVTILDLKVDDLPSGLYYVQMQKQDRTMYYGKFVKI